MKKFLKKVIVLGLFFAPQAYAAQVIKAPAPAFSVDPTTTVDSIISRRKTISQVLGGNTTASVAGSGYEMRGCIKVEGGVDKLPEFVVCFNGKETKSNREGFFNIPLEGSALSKFSVVVCKEAGHHFQKRNTIDHVAIVPKEYRYAVCSKTWGNVWSVVERKLDDKRRKMPDNCLTILIDPKFVDRIVPWELELGGNIVRAPTIVLKEDVCPKKLARESAARTLEFLDDKPFHESVVHRIQKPTNQPKVQLSLAQ